MPSVEDSEADHVLEQQLTDIERQELARITEALERHGESAEQIWATGGTLPGLTPAAERAEQIRAMLSSGCAIDPRAAAVLGARAAFAAYDASQASGKADPSQDPQERIKALESSLRPSGRPIVGVGGWATAGKDAAADFLEAHHGYGRTYTSEPLREALLTLNPIIRLDHDIETLEGWTLHAGEHTTFVYLDYHVGYTEAKKHKEVRRLLQVLGTDVARNMFGEDVWVNKAAEKIRTLHENVPVVITGIRYRNELEMIHALGGHTVWVQRPGVHPESTHTSETSLNHDDFDYVLHNDGTLEQLREKVAKLHAHLIRL